MLGGIFHLIIIGVAVWAIITGYRSGMIRRLGSVLAVTFGIVITRLLAPETFDFFDGCVPGFFSGFNREFIVKSLACGVIYVFFTGLLELGLIPLAKLMKVYSPGVLDSIAGALFRLFQAMMLISILYNLIVDFSPSGSLARSSRLHDGNVVEGVIKIAPAILGYPDGEEVTHFQQLEDAKKIS